MNNVLIFIGTLLSGCLGALPALSDKGLTDNNWLNHEGIKEVRAVVKTIQTGIARKSFKGKSRSFKYCEPYQDTARILYSDTNNIPRKYRYEAGSGDSSLRWDLYYDRTGKIRFAFIRGGAANGTEIEHRIYFDRNGKRIWEIQKLISGPGYTFPSKPWPEKEVNLNPSRRFASLSKCEEVK